MIKLFEKASIVIAIFAAALLTTVVSCGIANAGEYDANSYRFDTGYVDNLSSGTASYDSGTKTLTLNNASFNELVLRDNPTINIVLNGSNQCNYIDDSDNHSNISIKGKGSLNAKAIGKYSFVNSLLRIDSGNLTLGKEGITAHSFTMNGGKLSISSPNTGINIKGTRTNWGDVTITGGVIKITNPKEYGIHVDGGNMKMTGGDVSITGSYVSGINIGGEYDNGKYYGGKLTISGGSVTSTIRNRGFAINAASISNKPTCLKKIKGWLPSGATLKIGGNEYSTTDSITDCVLTKYGSNKKSFTFNTFKFGGCKYYITGIGSKAFNTKAGSKVKSLTFKSVRSINAKLPPRVRSNAFYGTKSLTSLKFYCGYFSVTTKSLSGVFSKTAFRKAGKASGKKLTVYVQKPYNLTEKQATKIIRKKGLPKSAKAKAFIYY